MYRIQNIIDWLHINMSMLVCFVIKSQPGGQHPEQEQRPQPKAGRRNQKER